MSYKIIERNSSTRFSVYYTILRIPLCSRVQCKYLSCKMRFKNLWDQIWKYNQHHYTYDISFFGEISVKKNLQNFSICIEISCHVFHWDCVCVIQSPIAISGISTANITVRTLSACLQIPVEYTKTQYLTKWTIRS